MQHYSIAEAKNNLSRIVHEAEEGQTVHLTRRGKLVAVLLSADEFNKVSAKQTSPADTLTRFLNDESYKQVDIDPAVFEGLRTKTSGRDITL